jgi:hypothetical protein
MSSSLRSPTSASASSSYPSEPRWMGAKVNASFLVHQLINSYRVASNLGYSHVPVHSSRLFNYNTSRSSYALRRPGIALLTIKKNREYRADNVQGGRDRKHGKAQDQSAEGKRYRGDGVVTCSKVG